LYTSVTEQFSSSILLKFFWIIYREPFHGAFMKSMQTLLTGSLLLCLSPLNLQAANVRMNQIGFHTDGAKRAVILNSTAEPIVVHNSQGATVATATVTGAKNWAPSGENALVADFSDLSIPGTYSLYQGTTKIGRDFTVSATPFEAILKGSLKFYYYQRASFALSSTYAGVYARPAGHPDNNVSKSFAGGGANLSSPKGWYDAGDYGKYIVNSGITTSTLMLLYEHYQAYFDALTWNIPESANAKSDLLDEIKWNLDWMLTMQTTDGGVYSKLTTEVFSDAVMPNADVATRYVFMKTTAATFDFAAVMAQASRLYNTYDAAFATTCLAASERAYSWGKANSSIYYLQPASVNTGEYGDNNATDERLWAATQLYLSTKTAGYLTDISALRIQATTPDWGSVGMMGFMTMALYPTEFGTTAISAKDSVLRVANTLRDVSESSGYGVPITSNDFVWGSNAVAANQGMVLLHAYYLTQDLRYLHAARQAMDYLLGRNPLDRTYLTGFGVNSPMNPHHRPSQADGITAPVPGMLAGGPHTGGQDVGTDTWTCSNYVVAGKPALSYTDNTCSYATNEIAINWNAPFAYLSGSLEALYNGELFMGKNLNPSPVSVAKPRTQTSQHLQMRSTGNGVRAQFMNADGSIHRSFRLDGRRE
jgi:endoglucanase